MKRLDGWIRLYIVFAIVTGVWNFYLGSEAHRDEKISIAYTGEQLAKIMSASRPASPMEQSILADLRERQDTNIQRQVEHFGKLWCFWLAGGAVTIWSIRFILLGFKPSNEQASTK